MWREQLRQQRGRQGAKQIAESQACLEKAQRVAAPSDRCMLGNEHPGTGHFAAYRRPLENPQCQQNQRGEITDFGIGRHYPDQQARQGHHQDTQAEDLLASQVVGKVRHQDPAQGSGQVAGDKDPEALQQTQPLGHLRREEQLAEGQGEEHEDDEIVDFQRAAQCRQAQGFVVTARQA
ncbi:hypothetical protein D3C79_781620 [compost metagenome]